MNLNEPTFQVVLRDTTQNHTETPPDCDARCARWEGLAHAHICPDGINNDDTPFMDVTAWCSCGARLGEPVRLDMRDGERKVARASNFAGLRFVKAFELHMAVAHGINVQTDIAWQARLTTPVGAPPPQPKMHRIMVAGTPGIECLACDKVSFNPNDVAEVYCANCKLYGVLQ